MSKTLISKSLAAKVSALALVAVLGISFIASIHAAGDLQLQVSVSDACGPVMAKITIVNGPDDGAQGYTDSNGQFTFPNLNPGTFYLHVEADNHDPKDTAGIDLTSNQNISILLNRADGCPTTTPSNVGLSFHVHANCIGENIAGATVSGGGTSGTTNSAGNVTLTVPANTNIAWTASATGYNNASGTNNSDGGNATVDVTLTRTCGGGTPAPICTTGTITVTSNIPTSTWTITRPNGETFSSSGSKTFTDVALGAYSIRFDDVSGFTKSIPSGTTGTLVGCGTLNGVVVYTAVTNPPPPPLAPNPPPPVVVVQTPVPPPPPPAPNPPPPPPVPTVFLSVSKNVRNISRGEGSFNKSTSGQSGDQFEFIVNVSANSTSGLSAQNVNLIDTLPSNFVLTRVSLDGNVLSTAQQTGQVTFSLGTMNAGMSHSISMIMTANGGFPSGSSAWNNNVRITASNTGDVTDFASVTISLPGNINLVLSKKAFNETQGIDATSFVARPGDVIAYTLSVFNQGSITATNFAFQDDLREVLEFSDLTDAGSGSLSGNMIFWPNMDIGPGSSVSKVFRVTVRSSIPSNTDLAMVNTFGSTVRVPVRKGVVAGTFVAPKTGPAGSLALVLSLTVMLGYIGFRKFRPQSASIIS
jgi:uncharacterized repeat protein (TIGR01451 family)